MTRLVFFALIAKARYCSTILMLIMFTNKLFLLYTKIVMGLLYFNEVKITFIEEILN